MCDPDSRCGRMWPCICDLTSAIAKHGVVFEGVGSVRYEDDNLSIVLVFPPPYDLSLAYISIVLDMLADFYPRYEWRLAIPGLRVSRTSIAELIADRHDGLTE